MKKTITLKIYGKVQGVFYRKSAKQKAEELGLTGYVRNESDGSVFSAATGTEAQLQDFIRWCHQGPSGAFVSSVITATQPLQEFDRFTIMR